MFREGLMVLIPFIILVLLLLVVYSFFLAPLVEPPDGTFEEPPPECAEGKTEPCFTSEGCRGTKACSLGRWTECLRSTECTPWEKEYCTYTTCLVGVRTCDECGYWGQCLPRNITAHNQTAGNSS